MWLHQKTRSVCVKQALNTRRWLVNALVTWHVSYKITTLLFLIQCSNMFNLAIFFPILRSLITVTKNKPMYMLWSYVYHFLEYDKVMKECSMYFIFRMINGFNFIIFGTLCGVAAHIRTLNKPVSWCNRAPNGTCAATFLY